LVPVLPDFGADQLNLQADVRPHALGECVPLIVGWCGLAQDAGCIAPRSQQALNQVLLADMALANVLNLKPRVGANLCCPLTNNLTQRFSKLRAIKNSDDATKEVTCQGIAIFRFVLQRQVDTLESQRIKARLPLLHACRLVVKAGGCQIPLCAMEPKSRR